MTHEATGETNALTIRDVMELPATVDVETAGRAFGIGRTHAYALVRVGQFPCETIRVGRCMRVVTADLRRVLRIPEQPAAEHAPAA